MRDYNNLERPVANHSDAVVVKLKVNDGFGICRLRLGYFSALAILRSDSAPTSGSQTLIPGPAAGVAAADHRRRREEPDRVRERMAGLREATFLIFKLRAEISEKIAPLSKFRQE